MYGWCISPCPPPPCRPASPLSISVKKGRKFGGGSSVFAPSSSSSSGYGISASSSSSYASWAASRECGARWSAVSRSDGGASMTGVGWWKCGEGGDRDDEGGGGFVGGLFESRMLDGLLMLDLRWWSWMRDASGSFELSLTLYRYCFSGRPVRMGFGWRGTGQFKPGCERSRKAPLDFHCRIGPNLKSNRHIATKVVGVSSVTPAQP
jgi:hypothetical protein